MGKWLPDMLFLFLCFSPTKVIVENIFRCDTKVVEHVDHGGAHRAWTAHVVFDVLGGGMVFKISLIHYIVHKTSSVRDCFRIGGGVGTIQTRWKWKLGKSCSNWRKSSR